MNPQLPYLGLQSERCLRSPKLPPLLRTIILLSGDAVKTLHHKFPASLSKKVSFQGVNGTSDPLKSRWMGPKWGGNHGPLPEANPGQGESPTSVGRMVRGSQFSVSFILSFFCRESSATCSTYAVLAGIGRRRRRCRKVHMYKWTYTQMARPCRAGKRGRAGLPAARALSAQAKLSGWKRGSVIRV